MALDWLMGLKIFCLEVKWATIFQGFNDVFCPERLYTTVFSPGVQWCVLLRKVIYNSLWPRGSIKSYSQKSYMCISLWPRGSIKSYSQKSYMCISLWPRGYIICSAQKGYVCCWSYTISDCILAKIYIWTSMLSLMSWRCTPNWAALFLCSSEKKVWYCNFQLWSILWPCDLELWPSKWIGSVLSQGAPVVETVSELSMIFHSDKHTYKLLNQHICQNANH